MRKPGAYARHAALASPPSLPLPLSPRSAGAAPHAPHRRALLPAGSALLLAALAWACLAAGFVARGLWDGPGGGSRAAAAAAGLPAYVDAPVLISYAYYEKDPIQVANFEFFLAAGTTYPARHSDVHWAIVVSGDNCSPCQGLRAVLK